MAHYLQAILPQPVTSSPGKQFEMDADMKQVVTSCLQILDTILSHKHHNFSREVIEPKACVLIFPTTFVLTHYACQILMKIEFSGEISKKMLNIKFYENLSSSS